MIKTEVFCTVLIDGVHSWPTCPHQEVAFLRDPHRHQFHIKAYVDVEHDDRDVEFIMLKHIIDEYLISKYGMGETLGFGVCDFGSMSCEMIARLLIERFRLSKCEVSEDGENGAVLTVTGE